MAHALPLAGHLGKQKTAQRILRRFYWLSVFKNVEKYCRQCPECQLVGRRVTGRAPLVPLPIVGTVRESGHGHSGAIDQNSARTQIHIGRL